MPALDRHHEVVKEALIRDGWTITHDPLALKIEKRRVHIDLGAERVLTADRGTEKIAVEIKTFGAPSPVAVLEQTLGQYILYSDLLKQEEPERTLYLAIPEIVYETIFGEEIGQMVLETRIQHAFCYSIEKKEITKWLE